MELLNTYERRDEAEIAYSKIPGLTISLITKLPVPGTTSLIIH